MATRTSQVIRGELKDRLLAIEEDKITSSFIYDIFGEYKGKSKCNPYDILEIPANMYGPEGKKNKKPFTTTVGLWIFNKWFIENELFDLFKYVNVPVGNKQFNKMTQAMAYALMEDRIESDALKHFLDKSQFVMQFVTMLAPNYTEELMLLTHKMEKKKEELIKAHKKELDEGDTIVAKQIEDELIQYAIDVMGDDPSMDTFVSGARSNINNHFKNLFVWKGATRDPSPDAKQEFRIATSNYADGVKKEEYSLYCNSGIDGAYSRGKKTESGGYLENLCTMAYQDLILGEPGSDCKTKRCAEVELNEKNVNRYMYNNIVTSSGKLVELNSQNAQDYIGKKVKMRMAYLCPHDKPCNACAGNMFYKLGIKNIGLSLMYTFSIYKNKAMKSFHDSTVGLTEIDTMAAFGLK